MTLRRPLLSASSASSARRLGLPALLLAAGCAPATVEGTSVGNPGLTAVRVAPADQLAPSLARLDVATVTAVSCSGDRQTVVSGVELDLLAPSQVALPGVHTQEPTFGLPATWVDAALKEDAAIKGYTVVDVTPEEMVVTMKMIDTSRPDAEVRDGAKFRLTPGSRRVEVMPVPGASGTFG